MIIASHIVTVYVVTNLGRHEEVIHAGIEDSHFLKRRHIDIDSSQFLVPSLVSRFSNSLEVPMIQFGHTIVAGIEIAGRREGNFDEKWVRRVRRV